MTTHRQRLLDELRLAVRGLSAPKLLDYLLLEGIIDERKLEERAIRQEVARRMAQGQKKCYAMGETAHEYCCSYEKVRGIIYRTH
ncbi:hypothetical protein [uncultured Alistipes sp.]|uniref:hypothetical protein n=1 Tax=uncultured Alistipes sp. TaxID=538949 RepID=UPI00260F3C53|nr:hypothetical protein [uncultured Alistipes sp.]